MSATPMRTAAGRQLGLTGQWGCCGALAGTTVVPLCTLPVAARVEARRLAGHALLAQSMSAHTRQRSLAATAESPAAIDGTHQQIESGNDPQHPVATPTVSHRENPFETEMTVIVTAATTTPAVTPCLICSGGGVKSL